MSIDPTVSAAVDLDDESYNSSEDEDFQLEGAQDDSDLSSDDDAAEPAQKKRKTAKKSEVPEDELDSGDEVTIRKAREKLDKKRKGKKSKGKNAADDHMDLNDDEGGTGGFVRTRAMKQQIREEEERKPLAKIDGATIDVDALWEQMNTPGTELGLRLDHMKHDSEPTPETEHANAHMKDYTPKAENDSQHTHGEEMIKIKRTYEFAGEMITEEKTVPKNSAEAKAFLSSGQTGENADVAAAPNHNLRRPLRKISRFDPNPTGTIKKSWEKQALEAGDQNASGPKINTVEKSRLDWAQYVDQAGISDELRVHSKAKEGYMGRMDFLGRTEARRDEEARQARLKGI
ncbi:uncharacterized protein N7503_012095 [Penicillium pulvis]|uniref:uncharacterized protein n=1 Tax=Penicillium pulvis TaxID=1562058 RepID=UPI0025498760|nr:uncharacterized protein N7503_012095 [Penicillium pulvis]KAJ5786883.1 hypothetical protein N7503_012095 [Penicillium pulvis]